MSFARSASLTTQAERFPDFVQIRRDVRSKKSHARAGIVAGGGDRVENFVGQRGGQLSHDAQAIQVRELQLQLAQSLDAPLARVCVPSHRRASRPSQARPACGDHRMAGEFEMFDGPVGKEPF